MKRLLALFLLIGLPVRAQLPEPADPTAFALALHRATATGGNVMSSPYSARQVLGMAYAGAAGATRAEMAKALRAGADFLEDEKRLRERLSRPDDSTLEIANAMFLKQGYAFLPSFLDTVESAFDAKIFVREFGDAALAEVNEWAKKRTHGRIPGILDSLKPNDRAVLLNAVYFKGKWAKAFPKQKTRGDRRGGLDPGGPYPVSFQPSAGKAFPLKLMSREGSIEHHQQPGFSAVRLPYRGRLRFIAVLPDKDSSIAALRASLNSGEWARMRDSLEKAYGLVAIPKFKFEASMDLNKPLVSMGMGLAFDREKADFSRMSRPKSKADELFISRALQKTFVELDEEGTTAAVVTSAIIAVRGSGGPRKPPFEFIADRPFLFAIEDGETGAILFIGEVHDPRKRG
ncbi:MAG: serpin family protein [Elusimicrobiota bacterium]|nr:serpin family protein [Elusimicrobiota bacterium]